MVDGAGPVAPTGSTRLAAVIGSPVRHSRSPALINAAFASARLDWTFVALEVAPGGAAAAIDAMRVLGLGGLSVTMPHKHDVIARLDRLSPEAAALDAVNCVAWDGDDLVGHNTDGWGLLEALAIDHDLRPDGLRCVVFGAGGAARSVVRALGEAGAAEVVVVNRTPAKGRGGRRARRAVGRVRPVADVADADLVINATSVGMGAPADDRTATVVGAELLSRARPWWTSVYLPLETPLLRRRRGRGAGPVDGIGMLVHQAALAVELWTGDGPRCRRDGRRRPA